MKRKLAVLAALLCAALGLLAANGVVSTKENPLQVAILHWYNANQVPTSFSAGFLPVGVAFDGASIWVANAGSESNNVMKFRASDGALLLTSGVGTTPTGIAFDGANIWTANQSSNNVTKVQASTGTVLGSFTVGTNPIDVAFDGANIWVTNYQGASVTKLQASNGAALGTFAVGSAPLGIAFDGTDIWVANSGEQQRYEAKRGRQGPRYLRCGNYTLIPSL